MINAKNLLLSNTIQLNSPAASKGVDDPLNLGGLSDGQIKEGMDKEQNAADPNAFILLLNQTFSTQHAQNPLNTLNTLADQEIQGKPGSFQAPIVDINSTLTPPDLLVNSSFQESHGPIVGLDNPALNWIDSDSFQSLSTSEVAAQSMLDQSLGLTPHLNLKTDSAALIETSKISLNQESLQVAKPISAPLINTTNEEVSPMVEGVKNTMAQNVQQLTPAGINYSAVVDDTIQSDSILEVIGSNLNTDQEGTVLNTQAQASAQTSHVPTQKSLEISLPINHAQWGDKFADQIVWLGQNNIKSALIRINPEELGPIEISIKVVKDSASVNIISPSLQVRDLVDQALPRLREMMADQGLNLTNVQVSTDSRSNNQSAQNNNSDSPFESSFFEGDEEVVQVTSIKKPPKSLIDYFA